MNGILRLQFATYKLDRVDGDIVWFRIWNFNRWSAPTAFNRRALPELARRLLDA